MLTHAEWGGRNVIEDAYVLDVFAGTGALALEALSRGAAFASLVESDAAALRALRLNVITCQAADRVKIMAGDALNLPLAPCTTQPASLVFLDPPYRKNLVPRALSRLNEAGCISSNALIVAETAREETWVPEQPLLAERRHGAARLLIFRAA